MVAFPVSQRDSSEEMKNLAGSSSEATVKQKNFTGKPSPGMFGQGALDSVMFKESTPALQMSRFSVVLSACRDAAVVKVAV